MTAFSNEGSLTWPAGAAAPGYVDELGHVIGRCLAGEQAAYVELYDQFAARVYRLTYSLLQDQQDAEEVLQDTFEYAFRKLRHFDPAKSALKTWLFQIAISRCHNKRRRKWLPSLSLSAEQVETAADPHQPQLDEVAALNSQQRAVWQALAQLSPKLRETVVLRYYEGLTYGEIGVILDIPAKTAESRTRLAHKVLHDLLAGLV